MKHVFSLHNNLKKPTNCIPKVWKKWLPLNLDEGYLIYCEGVIIWLSPFQKLSEFWLDIFCNWNCIHHDRNFCRSLTFSRVLCSMILEKNYTSSFCISMIFVRNGKIDRNVRRVQKMNSGAEVWRPLVYSICVSTPANICNNVNTFRWSSIMLPFDINSSMSRGGMCGCNSALQNQNAGISY